MVYARIIPDFCRNIIYGLCFVADRERRAAPASKTGACLIFNRLFASSELVSRHQGGPVLDDRLAYLNYRVDVGMAKNTLIGDATYLLAIAETLRLGRHVRRRFHPVELRDAAAVWAGKFSKSRKSQTNFQFIAMRWFDFVGRLKKERPSPGCRVTFVAAWADHMRVERGLSPVTIDKRCWWVRRFLNRPDIPQGVLRKITIADIDAAFIAMSSTDGYARSTLKTRAIGLRSFFTFAESRG